MRAERINDDVVDDVTRRWKWKWMASARNCINGPITQVVRVILNAVMGMRVVFHMIAGKLRDIFANSDINDQFDDGGWFDRRRQLKHCRVFTQMAAPTYPEKRPRSLRLQPELIAAGGCWIASPH